MNQKLLNSFATILIDGFEIEGKTVKYSQMHRTDTYSQHSSIIWPVWVNG